MKELFISEWERLWNKKTTWLCFLSIPIILIGTLKYYLRKNMMFTPSSPEYTTFLNFPSVAMQEQLISVINILALLFIVLSITEEYRSGQLRMVMIRTYSFSKIVITKYLVVLVTLLLFLICYFVMSVILGYVFLPKNDSTVFFFINHSFTLKAALIYNIKYYIIAFVTLASMAAVYMFVGIISKTTTIAVAINIGFLILSLIYGSVVELFTMVIGKVLAGKLMFLSIIQIQYKGICILLSGKSFLNWWICGVLCVYMILFMMLSYILSKKQDNLI